MCSPAVSVDKMTSVYGEYEVSIWLAFLSFLVIAWAFNQWGTSGGKKSATTLEAAITKLQSAKVMLTKKSKSLEERIIAERDTAKKSLGSKRATLMALMKKKRLEKQLQQVDGMLLTIESLREAVENANTETEVLKSMSCAKKALQSAHQQLDVDDVHEMLNDIQEQNELSNEILDAVSVYGMDIDRDELMNEFENLEQEVLDEELLKISKPVTHSSLD